MKCNCQGLQMHVKNRENTVSNCLNFRRKKSVSTHFVSSERLTIGLFFQLFGKTALLKKSTSDLGRSVGLLVVPADPYFLVANWLLRSKWINQDSTVEHYETRTEISQQFSGASGETVVSIKHPRGQTGQIRRLPGGSLETAVSGPLVPRKALQRFRLPMYSNQWSDGSCDCPSGRGLRPRSSPNSLIFPLRADHVDRPLRGQLPHR